MLIRQTEGKPEIALMKSKILGFLALNYYYLIRLIKISAN